MLQKLVRIVFFNIQFSTYAIFCILIVTINTYVRVKRWHVLCPRNPYAIGFSEGKRRASLCAAKTEKEWAPIKASLLLINCTCKLQHN